MKRLISLVLITCLLLIIVGCQKNEHPTTAPVDTTEPATTTATESTPVEEAPVEPAHLDAPNIAVSLPIETNNITADDGTVIYTGSHQVMALTMNGQVTADLIITDFMSKVLDTTDNAESIVQSANTNYVSTENWVPYSLKVRYTPMRIDSSVLSLYGTVSTYTGGSHPDYACKAANYNLISGDALTLGSILTHEDKVDTLRDLVIEQLTAQKDEKFLQDGFESTINDRFAKDVSYDADWYFSDTGLCFYFAPYEIAPYSSGVIIAEIPYADLADVVSDEFFPAEDSIINGNATVTTENKSFAQISELVYDQDGDMYFIEVDSCIKNIRISYNVIDTNSKTTDIIYAAHYLNPGDAIMVQATADNAANMTVNYTQNGESIAIPLINQ